MIYCHLKDLANYELKLSHSLEELYNYITKNKSNLFQKGKMSIDKDTFFAIGLEYETKNEQKCVWEAHRRFLDIHYILEGEETIYISDIRQMTPKGEYNTEHDYQLFEGEKLHEIRLKKGEILILHPQDIHKTGISKSKVNNLKKIVFKIELE